MNIGDTIKRELEARGMSQVELAEKAGLKEVSISRYINNTRKPSYESLIAIADAFGMSLDALVGREKTEPHLKPCPFCGGKAVFTDCGQDGDFEDWDVECSGCGILMIAPGEEPGSITSKEEAAAKWNRRVRT